MKALKIVAIVMCALLLVMLAMLAYLFMTAEVSIQEVSTAGVSAAQQTERFEALRESLAEDTFLGTVYQKPAEWKDASEYVFLHFTVRLRNGCLVPIDMIEVQVVPQPTDVVQLGDLQTRSLPAKTSGDVEAVVLAHKDAHPVRELLVTYYVWGVSFQLKTLSGQGA